MNNDLRTLVDQLKALAHPLRLRVLALLGSGELCVCQVAEILQVAQSSVSEALRELRRAGFISERKEGRWVFVSVVRKKDASLLQKAILAEVENLAEVHFDRSRTCNVLSLPLPIPCPKGASKATTKRTATHA